MARRVYRLPRQDELTKDQRRVLRMPQKGQHLVVGAPGTGKSVVALLRARGLIDPEKSFFLTFNHVLSHATKQLFEGELSCNTAMSLLYSLNWALMEGTRYTYDQDKMPEREPHKPDYAALAERFKLIDKDYSDYQIIIDEGQDLPQEWYDCLTILGFEDFFVVADQNQQITEENSSRSQLQEVLGLGPSEYTELKENFRNTTAIALFASTFYTDKASPKPDLPDRPTTDVPILFEYSSIDQMKEMVLNEYDRDPSKLIGFIVPTESKRGWYVKTLANDDKKRSNSKPLISTYFAQQKEGDVNIDFSYGGIVVLNDKSVKGIEFDTVFIVLDQLKLINNDIELLKKRMYVMSSRAREKLFMFKSAIVPSVVDGILPKLGETVTYSFKRDDKVVEIEEEILKRRSI